MFGLFGNKSPTSIRLDSLDDIKTLMSRQGTQKAGATIKEAADNGNVTCQIFLSQAGLSIPANKRPDHVQRDTERYTRLAAENGDVTSQYNLAKIYINQLNTACEYWSEVDVERIRLAKQWTKKAASQGDRESMRLLKELDECFPDEDFA